MTSLKRYQVESEEKWMEWIDKIPYLTFPSHWQIKVIPPFCGAMARFFVRTDKMPPGFRISIYLDCYNNLGYASGPYWEVYPHDGDVFRCAIDNTEALIKAISEAIEADEKYIEEKNG